MTQTATSVRLAAFGLATLLAGAPLAAAESAIAAPPGPIAASIPAAVAAIKPAPKLLLAQAAETAADTASSDRPFLKTGKGRLAVGLVAIGTGFAIKSKFDNRVKSPGR